MNWWVRFHRRPWYWRWLVKKGVFALTLFAVCFPNPRLFVRHVRHSSDPNALINAKAPVLQPMLAELVSQVAPSADAAETLTLVQRHVYRAVPYAFDWETWGQVDYLPTVEEVFAAGREDCDGRAVVAASLLRGLGFDAQLVADGLHVWVWTPRGETMDPRYVRTVRATQDGWEIDLGGLKILPRGAAYGIAVFPLAREVVVLIVLWFLLLRPGAGRVRWLGVAAALASSLCLVRFGGREWHQPVLWSLWLGLAILTGGLVLAFAGRGRSDVVARCV